MLFSSMAVMAKAKRIFFFQQALEPARLVGDVATVGNGFRVAGAGSGAESRAVEGFAGPWHAAHDFGQRPAASALGLRFSIAESGVQRWPAAVWAASSAAQARSGGVDVLVHELEQAGLEILRFSWTCAASAALGKGPGRPGYRPDANAVAEIAVAVTVPYGFGRALFKGRFR